MSDHPISATYLDEQVARASAILPAAGAFDATPTEMFCAGFKKVTLYLKYNEDADATAGAVTMRIEVSPDSTGVVWHRLAAYEIGPVNINTDTLSLIQREDIEFGAVGTTDEFVVYGPIDIEGTVQRIRVSCAESGDTTNPGVCEVEARFA